MGTYNTVTQETMVFQHSNNWVGQRVCKKLYLRCHHRQRNTGKNNKVLRTTHQLLRSNKNCNCPAQVTLTVLQTTQWIFN